MKIFDFGNIIFVIITNKAGIKMNNKLIKTQTVPVSMCDNKALLAIPSIFSVFMDIACEHSNQMNLGANKMAEKDLIWITVRTKIEILRRPDMLSEISVSTWPEKPGSLRCNRYYTIYGENGLMITGKSEWAMLNTRTGKLARIADNYPSDFQHLTDTVCDDPFTHVSRDISDFDLLGEYTVTSRDIDLAQHMNNTAYIDMIFSFFSCREIEKMNIKSVEISFRSPCYESEKLICRYKKSETGMEICVIKGDGTVAATVFIRTGVSE